MLLVSYRKVLDSIPDQVESNEIVEIQVFIIVLPHMVISTHNGPAYFLKVALQRLLNKHDDNRCAITSSSWGMYVIMDAIVDMTVDLVDRAVHDVNTIDTFIFQMPVSEQGDVLM